MEFSWKFEFSNELYFISNSVLYVLRMSQQNTQNKYATSFGSHLSQCVARYLNICYELSRNYLLFLRWMLVADFTNENILCVQPFLSPRNYHDSIITIEGWCLYTALDIIEFSFRIKFALKLNTSCILVAHIFQILITLKCLYTSLQWKSSVLHCTAYLRTKSTLLWALRICYTQQKKLESVTKMKLHTVNTPLGLAVCVMQPLLNCCLLSETYRKKFPNSI